MELFRNKEEEILFHQLRKRLQDESKDPMFKRHLEYMYDNHFLMGTLRCKKLRLDGAIDSVKKMLHIIPNKYPETFKQMHPSILRHVIMTPGLGPLKHRATNGSQILTVHARHWDTNNFSLEDLFLACIMLGIGMSKVIENQDHGMIVVINIDGLNLSQARQLTPFLFKRIVNIILFSLPMRFAGIHLTNINPLLQIPLAIAKTFLPHKIKKRLYVHNNCEDLHEHFPRDKLPESLGGSLSDAEAYDYPIIQSLFSTETLSWYDNLRLIAEMK